MGNHQSMLKGLQIDKSAVETNNFWSLYNAEIPNDDHSTYFSIFQEEPFVSGQLWITQTPLRRAIRNFMIYRHPCILKYITSWDQGSTKFLATERSQPLSLVIQLQSDIQICLGLKNILSSLIFLVEQAKARHLNICMSSIFVNSQGEWRLAGFEYVWKTKEITQQLLDLTKSYRYEKAIDPNETKTDPKKGGGEGENLEQYAFAVFCEELLKDRKNSSVPYVQEFYDYCLTHLKHQNTTMRPKLSAILLHPFFNHEFILIHSFLMELPLKGPQEKQDFFTSLIDRLRYFDENIVASQIGNLLLSRMVLLDPTAQLCVTPYVLKTKSDISSALFSQPIFTKYIVPRIMQIFCVRDAQIRLILLEYFNEYVKLLTKEELKDQILPNLLLGIKDTNDILVAKTLRCLADLIPILGATTVIGDNRSRLFADGRPQSVPDVTVSHWVQPRSITPVMASDGDEYNIVASASPLPPNDTTNFDTINGSFVSMPTNNIMNDNTSTETTANLLLISERRLSPDGGEDIQVNITDGDVEEEEDAWTDWENDGIQTAEVDLESSKINLDSSTSKDNKILVDKNKSHLTKVKIIDDINELDIKNQKMKITPVEEFDFFKDMEPVIQCKNNLIVQETIVNENSNELKNEKKQTEVSKSQFDDIEVDKSRFEFQFDENEAIKTTAWDDDDDDGNDWNGA